MNAMPPSRFAFSVGTETFANKGEAREAVRRILHEAEIDERLRGDRAVLVRDLFGMHPYAAEKAQGGVAGFMVRTNDFNGAKTRGFHVVHDDGSTTAFSYEPCLNPKKPPIGAAGAMRAAIMLGQRQIMVRAFAGRSSVRCPACAKPMSMGGAHVHHLPPNRFRDIAAAYIAEHGEPKVEKSALGVAFASITEQRRWVEFHDARARRAVVCAPCNYAAEREA